MSNEPKLRDTFFSASPVEKAGENLLVENRENQSPRETPKPPNKKETIQGCGCLALVLIAVAVLLKSCLGGDGLSKSDLKNPSVALEKLAKQAFDSEKGFEFIKVEPMGPNQDSYSLNVSYHANFVLSEEATFKDIRFRMERAYHDILKYPELPLSHLKINAQLNLQDRFGNEKGWSDVYRTQLSRETLDKLNRQNMDAVDFRTIWETVFTHHIFSEL